MVRRIGDEIIGNLDEDGYLRAEVDEIARRCGVDGRATSRRCSPWSRASTPPAWPRAPCRSASSSSCAPIPPPIPLAIEIVEEHFDALSKRRYPDIARALKRPLDRVMEAIEEIMALEPKPGRQLRDERHALHRAGRGRAEGGRRVHRGAQRGGHSAPAGERPLPVAAARLRRRGQAVRGAEAALGHVAHQERGPAPAHPAQGDPVHREVPAGLPGPGHRPPAAPSPCATWARTSACTSPPSAGSPPTSTWRRPRGSSS